MSTQTDNIVAIGRALLAEKGYATPEESMQAMGASLEEALPRATSALDVVEEPIAEPLIHDLLLRGEYALVAGEGGCGKSSLVLVMACAVAGGYRAFGHFQAEKGPVLIVSEEDSASTTVARAEAICRGHGWDRSAVLGNLHFLALVGARLDSAAWALHIADEVERLQAVLVILDPLYELTSVEESSNSDMRPAVRAIRALSRCSTNPGVVVVHHITKNSESRKMDRVRGAGAIRDAARLVYFVSQSDDGEETTVECLKASRSERLPPFVIRTHIEASPENRSKWDRARFEYASVREASLDRASLFILDQLEGGLRLNTTQLKEAAKGTKMAPTDLATSLKLLEMRRLIDFQPGENNSKLWGLKQSSEVPARDPQPGLHPDPMQPPMGVAYASV